MTKKHFKAIATAIKENRTTNSDYEFHMLTERLCDIFQAENPRFNREKFINATK